MSGMLFDQANESTHDTGCKRTLKIPADVKVEAKFAGPNDCYRTKLIHRWAPGPAVMFAMMNPSDAALDRTDSTIAKTSQYARMWGFGALMVGNACAYRATQQKELLRVPDPVGALHNWPAVEEMANEADLIIVAHGRLPKALAFAARDMVNVIWAGGRNLHALRVSPDGNPWHPLYLPLNLKPFVWEGYATV